MLTRQDTEFLRSNVIAVKHTVKQMYGEAVARDAPNLAATQNSRS
jgi:hypothetical protein